MKHVFILAAGSRERWEYPYPKQLAAVGPETCLARQIRQIRARGGEPFIVTHDLMIHNAASHLGVSVLYPNMHRFTCETLLSTASLWKSPMLVIVGDGVFTKRAMDSMMNNDDPLHFFGNPAELMGMAFDRSQFEAVETALRKVLELRDNPTGKQRNPAKLWNLYRVLLKIPINQHVVKHTEPDDLFHHFTDCSFDIDTVEIYQTKVALWQRQLDDYPEKAIAHAD